MSPITAYPPADPRKPVGLQLALAAGALLALVGLGYIYVTAQPDREAATTTTIAEPVAAQADAAPESRGLEAIRKGHFVAPAGDNALELYLAELEADPANQSASQAVMELLPLASDALAVALARGDATEHARLLALLTRADPKSPMLDSFQSAWDERQIAMAAPVPEPTAATSAVEPALTATAPPVAEPALPSNTRAPELAETQAEQAAPTQAKLPTPVPSPTATAQIKTPEPAEPLLRVVDPVLVSSPAAQYPSSAKRQKIEGWVEFKLTLDREGRVTDAQIVGAEPNRLFDVEARRAVMRWRFQPKRVDNVAVEAVVRQRLSFKLRA